MLAPFDAVLAGTWSSGDLPSEISDFALMRGMGWTWRELAETPLYVRVFCVRFLDAIAEHDNRRDRPDGIVDRR